MSHLLFYIPGLVLIYLLASRQICIVQLQTGFRLHEDGALRGFMETIEDDEDGTRLIRQSVPMDPDFTKGAIEMLEKHKAAVNMQTEVLDFVGKK